MPDAFASRKSQGIPVLVLEEGHAGQAGRMVPIFQIGKQRLNREREAQTGKGTHPRSESMTSFRRRQLGWVNIRTFPTMGSSTEPQVSAPQCTRPDKKSAIRAPVTVDKIRVSLGWGDTQRYISPPAHPKSGSDTFPRLLAHSDLSGEMLPFLEHFVPCEWRLGNNSPSLSLDQSLYLGNKYWLCPRGDVGTHLLGESGENKLGMLRSGQPSR